MHYRYLVTIPKDKAKDSADARRCVNSFLEEEGFCSQGRFSSGMADSFVIGGRWSGELTSMCLDQEKLKKVNEELGEDHFWFGGKGGMTKEKRLEQYKKVFMKHFPDFNGILPLWRDSYNPDGMEDDAKIIDEVLWNNLMEKVIKENNEEHFSDMEYELDSSAKKEDVVGKYWVVVVDYHN